MLRRLFLLFIFLSSFTAKANFDFNANCIAAYNNIMDLKLNTARLLIAAEKKQNPQNSITVLLDNYVDYYYLFTSEDKSDFDRLKGNKAIRLARLEKEDIKSPYYLYSMAEINMQWAYLRGNFREYYTAGWEIKKASSLLQQNAEKFPDFLPNQKCIAVVNVFIGSLPDGLKGLLGILGLRGNTQAGVRNLESLVAKLPRSAYSHFYDETVYSLAIIQTDILKDTLAFEHTIKNTNIIRNSSLLKTSIRAYVAVKTAHNSEAINVLENRPTGNIYQSYPYLDYLYGTANMHRLNRSAGIYFQAYLKEYNGINYIKEAYLNLAWLALLSNDTASYNSYISLVKTKGYSNHYKDEQALKEANDPIPNTDLLKARLLFDGGFFDKALNLLEGKKIENFRILRDKLEFHYRLGRVYEALGKTELCIRYYQSTLAMGKNERYYFAANSAISLGLIYEKRKDYAKAKSMYNTAIGLKNHDYEVGTEQKAKDGLKRIAS